MNIGSLEIRVNEFPGGAVALRALQIATGSFLVFTSFVLAPIPTAPVVIELVGSGLISFDSSVPVLEECH